MKHLLFIILVLQNYPSAAEEKRVFKKEPDFTKKIVNTIYTADEISSRKLSSTYVDSFDPATTFYVPMLSSQLTDCAQKREGGLSSGFIRNIDGIKAPVLKMQCDYVKELSATREFTPERCAGVANCLKDKLDYSSAEARYIFLKAREEVAKETVAMTAKQSIVDMLEFEELRLFSAAKYGDEFFPQSCQGFNVLALTSPKRAQCRSPLDKGFELAQKVCRIPETDCQKDYLDFSAKNTAADDESIVAKYISSKTEKTNADVFKNESSILQKIAFILADGSKTPEERVEATFNFMGDSYQDLDPVFKDYYNRSFKDKSRKKQDLVRESLLSYVKNSKKSSVDIIVDLENLRKSEAKKMLEDQCGKITRLDDMCNVVNDVIGGIEVYVDRGEFNKVITRQDGAFPTAIAKDEIAKNVARCNTFVLTSVKSNYSFTEQRLSGGYDLFSPGESKLKQDVTLTSAAEGRTKIVIGPQGVVTTNTTTALFKDQFKKEEPLKERSSELVLVRNFAKNDKLPEVYNKDIDGNKGSAGVIAKKEIVERINPARETVEAPKTAPQIVDNFSSAPRSGAPGVKAVIPNTATPFEASFPGTDRRADGPVTKPSELPQSGNDYQQLLGKVSELEQRLAKRQGKSAEESVSAPAEEDSSLIKELKAAKNELAEMNKERVARATGAEEKGASRKIASTETSDRDEEESDDRDEDDSSSAHESSSSRNTASGRSAASVSSASPTSGASSASERAGVAASVASENISSARVASDGADSVTTDKGNDAVVLLKVEGSASSDKLNELIYAESGKAFYIEENGMVKEIIPAVVDGKIVLNSEGMPVYKVVSKGKVRDFKLDKKIVSKKLAKIESPADLKRADNDVLSAPAVRYRELQNILHKKASVSGN